MTTVTWAIIEYEGEFLIARRPKNQKLAGKWEFSGGKLMGESLGSGICQFLTPLVEVLLNSRPAPNTP